MKNWTGRLLWGEAGQEIMRPLADLGRRGGNEVTPQGFPLITEGATKSHPKAICRPRRAPSDEGLS